MEKILVKDITVGRFVKVHRKGAQKVARGQPDLALTLSAGIICQIPDHRRFCVVQFFNNNTGKPIYRESFFWPEITIINRPQDFKGRLPERKRR